MKKQTNLKEGIATNSIEIRLKRDWTKVKEGDTILFVKSSSENLDKPFSREKIFKLFEGLRTCSTLDEIIDEIGHDRYSHLTVIFNNKQFSFLKSDLVRTYPIYYWTRGGQTYVTDWLSMNIGFELDNESIEEFVAFGYISGSHTIYKKISGIQAAEIIFFGNGVVKHRYFFNKTDETASVDKKLNIEEQSAVLDGIFLNVFKNMIDSIPGKGRIVVPLSGGHDSRLIVNYLYKLNFREVVCYTYGTAGNMQSAISRQVAEKLGYEWHFVEYTEEKWQELHDNGEIEKYFDFAFGGVSTPHLQDFLAIYELRNRGVIRKDDVVVPGHGLDILCHIIDADEYDIDLVTATIKRTIWNKKHYKNKKGTVQKRYREIHDTFPFEDIYFPDHVYWQERQAKFIINSLRVYEFFELGTRIPFWDSEVVRYWLTIPLELKLTRDFLFELEETSLIYDELQNVPYNRERIVNRSEIKNRFTPARMKRLIPGFLRIAYLRYTRRKLEQPEALNLIYSREIEDVSGLIRDLNRWHKQVRKYFRKDLKRLPFQINHELLIRLHTIELVFNKR